MHFQLIYKMMLANAAFTSENNDNITNNNLKKSVCVCVFVCVFVCVCMREISERLY